MRGRLVTLTVITGVALLGIIGLQAFWLDNLYTQQEERFKEATTNALATVILRTQVTSQLISYLQQGDSMSNFKLNIGGGMLTNMVKNDPAAMGQIEELNKSVKIEINESPSNTQSEQKLKSKILDNINKYSLKKNQAAPIDVFKRYRILLEEELHSKYVYAPFELAIVNKKDKVIRATCDTALFRRATYKSPPCQYDFEHPNNPYMLQAAFPGTNFYLLKRMIWQLTVSGLLVLICVCSFTYLIVLFFREKRLTEMRTDFMNNMTHELKTPISSVSVALELISDEQKPVTKTAQKEYLAIAQSELKRLLLLIERVLKMAAFEKKEIQIHKEYFEAAPWLNEQLINMRHMLENASAIIHTHISPEGLQIYADKTHITNVLHNLIENALKYNNKDVPQIEINIKREDKHIEIIVKDNGKGIPSYYLSKIFDQFIRVSYGDQHDVKGHGLGLSYVKAISDLHGGSVEVSSKLEEGSTFTIKIPA